MGKKKSNQKKKETMDIKLIEDILIITILGCLALFLTAIVMNIG